MKMMDDKYGYQLFGWNVYENMGSMVMVQGLCDCFVKSKIMQATSRF